jgi:hypothetical protein
MLYSEFMKEERFSPLLLEPYEFCVDDASVYYYPEMDNDQESYEK